MYYYIGTRAHYALLLLPNIMLFSRCKASEEEKKLIEKKKTYTQIVSFVVRVLPLAQGYRFRRPEAEYQNYVHTCTVVGYRKRVTLIRLIYFYFHFGTRLD